jgi:hypothetical protein
MSFGSAAFCLFLSSWAPFPAAAQSISSAQPISIGGGAAMSVVSLDNNSRTWQSPSGQQVIEIATGMNYFDIASQQWLRSDPSFVASPDGSSFVAAKLPNKVTLSADLDAIGAVTDVTPDGLTLQSTPVAIGLYDAASGNSVIIASLTNSQGVLLDAQHVLYPGALVGSLLQADVVYSLPDCGSFHQDVVITKFNGPLDPTVWGLPASATNSLRLQIFTEFYGDVPVPSEIMHPIQVETDPALRASMASPDLVDYTLGFGDVYCMSLGWAYVASAADPATGAATPPGAVQVVKEFVTAGQPARNFLIESIPYPWLANGLATLPPVQTAQLAPLPGESIRRTAMKNKALRSSLYAANQDRTGWCAALPRPAASQRQSGKGTVAVAKAAVADTSRTAGRRLVIDYVGRISGSTNSATYTNGATYFVYGPVYVNYADIQCGSVFKYPNNTPAFLEVEESLTIDSTESKSNAVFTAGDDNNHGGSVSNIWSNYTGHVSGYYGNPDLEVYDWSSLSIPNLSFYYASNGLALVAPNGNGSTTASVIGSLFTNCLLGITLDYVSGTGYMNLTETACTNINVNCAFSQNFADVGAVLSGCVFSNITLLISNNPLETYSTWTLTNCAVTNVTNFGAGSSVTITRDFNVNAYGAAGNGSQDDEPAISSALQDAVNWCSNVGPATLYFHGGSDYFLNTVDSLGNFFQVPPVTNLTLASDSGTCATLSSTILPTNINGFYGFNFWAPASGIIVSNLIISSSHGLTSNNSSAICFGGFFGSGTLQNITVTGCTFSGYAAQLLYQGCSNCAIYNNSFLYPMGRDSGSLNFAESCVGIVACCYPNQYFSIYSNYFNGLSATNTVINLVSGAAGDGLLLATVDGMNCYGNRISNSCFEGLFVASLPNAPLYPCSIYSNTIAKDISLLSGWGIRCDHSGAQVYGNTILNCGFGFSLSASNSIAANMNFYNNNVTVASSSKSWAFGVNLWPYINYPCCSNTFYNNTFTLNLSTVCTNTSTGSFPFPFNAGIAATYECTSNNYFSNNSFTVSASNTVNGYYGIALNQMFLDANFDNFTNNIFTNGGLGVYATNYPFGTNSPNTDGTNLIQATIASNNFFH